MTRRLLPLVLALAACTGGMTDDPELSSEPLTAEQLRDGCVRDTLDLIQAVVDRFGTATTPAGLLALGDRDLGAELSLVGDQLVVTLDEGEITIRRDPEGGYRIEGWLSTETSDGCTVDATFDDVFANMIADLPGGSGAVFTSGNVDLGLQLPDRSTVRGTAALIGRKALVALEVRGAHSQGEVALGGE